jgi:rubrerythrin
MKEDKTMPITTRSPLDDLTFDILTVLQNKAKALEAYEKYLRDAEDDNELHGLFVRIRDQDAEHVRVLKEALVHRFDEEFEDEDMEDYDDADEEEDVEDVPVSADAGEPPRRGESTQRR